MKDTNMISRPVPQYISHLNGDDIHFMATNLMRYCTSDFLTRLKAHYQRKQAILDSADNLSAEFKALGYWISDMHCFSHEAFSSESQLTHELLNRQAGFRGMLELESVYSLESLIGESAESEVVAVTSALLDTYPIDSDGTHLVSTLGTGNEYTNFAALLTWSERQIVKKKLNNETYRHNDFLIPYLKCVTDRDDEVENDEQAQHDITFH